MKMATWRQLVRATSDRIVDTDRRIERQRQLIQELASDGLDTVLAEQALTVLIEAGRRLSEDRQRIIDSMPGSLSAQEPAESFRKASDRDMPSLERSA